MKSFYEQIARKCKHFNGVSNEKCKLGIAYKDVEVPNSRPRKIPCMKDTEFFSGGHCDHADFPTHEEVEAQVKQMNEDSDRTLNSYMEIKKQIKDTGSPVGKIKCPACAEGELKYTAASSNGHIWAKCKCGFGWME